MTDTANPPDKLQALRAQLDAARTPRECIKARRAIADELWLKDPAAARPLLEQIVSEAAAAGEAETAESAAINLSELLRRAGDLEGSARYAELALKGADARGDRKGRACALNLVGLLHQERGEFKEALACFEEFLQLSRQVGFGRGERSALTQLAGIYGMQGDLEKALDFYHQDEELSVKAGDQFEHANSLHNIGWALEAMGRWAEASEYFHRAMAISEQHGFTDQLACARMELGEIALDRSDYEGASLMFRAVIEDERRMQQSGRLSREALANLGWTSYRRGDLARAEETLGEAARLNEVARDRGELASLERQRAEVVLAQGRLDDAESFLARAMQHASDLGLRKEKGEALRVQALLSAARDLPDPALELFEQADATLEPLGDTYELALSRLQHGRLLVDLGRSEEAQPLLKASSRTFHRLSVVAEAREAARLLYGLEVRTDRDSALLQAFFSVSALGLPPERFVEIALALLCDNFRFEQGALLAGGRPVAQRGRPKLEELPGRRSLLLQTDVALLLPVRQERRIVGHVWLRRARPAATRIDPGLLELVSRTLAPALAKLAELGTIEADPASRIAGLRYRGVVGRNREALEVLALVPRVAAAAVPVLVRGESGSGKELVALALHESGPRADRPFVTVNCAAVPESLLEAEFFGVETGAATGVTARPGKFQSADGGTIFLDEIGDMSPALQARLLRAIEEKTVTRVGGNKETKVDVRVVAATNMDLDERERQGLFRRDLLYRLNTVQFVLPPLRRRREDIPALTEYFIARTAQQYDRPVREASSEVFALFAEYAWPGNVRQLQHVVERAVILAGGDVLQIADLPPELRQQWSASADRIPPPTRDGRRKAAEDTERAMVVEALARAGGNATGAAKLAGYSRAQFYRLLRKHRVQS